jgi:hypothetical protein
MHISFRYAEKDCGSMSSALTKDAKSGINVSTTVTTIAFQSLISALRSFIQLTEYLLSFISVCHLALPLEDKMIRLELLETHSFDPYILLTVFKAAFFRLLRRLPGSRIRCFYSAFLVALFRLGTGRELPSQSSL